MKFDKKCIGKKTEVRRWKKMIQRFLTKFGLLTSVKKMKFIETKVGAIKLQGFNHLLENKEIKSKSPGFVAKVIRLYS
jgi:hypothetical protein